MNKKMIPILSYIVAALFVILAIMYFMTPANHLSTFIPGHDATLDKPHFKHGVAALLIAVGCVAFGWFQGGPKKSSQEN